MYNVPRIGVIAEAIKCELAREFPGVPVRRSYRADVDLDDEPRGPVITVMPDDCAFDPTRSRDCLWQEVGLIVAVTAPLDAESDTGGTLGEGWNERIDPLVPSFPERAARIAFGVQRRGDGDDQADFLPEAVAGPGRVERAVVRHNGDDRPAGLVVQIDVGAVAPPDRHAGKLPCEFALYRLGDHADSRNVIHRRLLPAPKPASERARPADEADRGNISRAQALGRR